MNKFFLILVFVAFTMSASSQSLSSNPLLVLNTYNQKGAPQKAISYYQSLATNNNPDIELKLGLGKAYYLSGEYKKATNIFIEINSENEKKANYELAQCYAQLNKPALSIQYLQVHLNSHNKKMQRTINSDDAFAKIENSREWLDLWKNEWYSKYDLLLEDAWYEYSNRNFEDALKIVDRLNNIRKSLVKAYYLKSLIYMELNEPENALIAINTAINKRNKIASYYAARSNIEIELNKSKKALKSIKTAISMDSTQPDFYFTRARAYLKSGNIDKSVEDLEAMIALVPDFDIYKLAGEIYYEGGEYQLALKAYNKCILQEKYNADIYISRGDVYTKIFAYEFAEKDYTMALDFQPFNGELYYKRGQTRKKLKKANLACSDYKKAFKYKYMKADDEIRSYCQGR